MRQAGINLHFVVSGPCKGFIGDIYLSCEGYVYRDIQGIQASGFRASGVLKIDYGSLFGVPHKKDSRILGPMKVRLFMDATS